MLFDDNIKKYVDQSVLCWLATASIDGQPNVSPKEVFDIYEDKLIIANIASPGSIKNIKKNNKVCVSFIDILVQKGMQIKGTASLINSRDKEFKDMFELLDKKTLGQFPFNEIIIVEPNSFKNIIAPRYLLYPETREEEQIASAKKSYGL